MKVTRISLSFVPVVTRMPLKFGDQTLTDNTTGLMWQKLAGVDGAMDWESALAYCQNLVLGAGAMADWRLPNIREMLTIITNTSPPLYDSAFDPQMGPMYWSSTTGLEGAGYVEIVDFSSGITPQEGDTLYIVTYNPIENDDVFQFRADDSYIVSVKEESITPDQFFLYQN